MNRWRGVWNQPEALVVGLPHKSLALVHGNAVLPIFEKVADASLLSLPMLWLGHLILNISFCLRDVNFDVSELPLVL